MAREEARKNTSFLSGRISQDFFSRKFHKLCRENVHKGEIGGRSVWRGSLRCTDGNSKMGGYMCGYVGLSCVVPAPQEYGDIGGRGNLRVIVECI